MNAEQEKKLRDLTNNHVLLCQSSLVDKMFEDRVFSPDNLENMYFIDYHEVKNDILENRSSEIKDNEDEIRGTFNNFVGEDIKAWIEDMNDEEIKELSEIIGFEINDYDIPQEVFEWWVVSDYLLNKLREHGEPILSNDYGDWWGRTTTGQAIYIDDVIREIFKV